jgi:magnesium transporter
MGKKQKRIGRYLPGWAVLSRRRRKAAYNPARETERPTPLAETISTIFDYDATQVTEHHFTGEAVFAYRKRAQQLWINMDGVKKDEVERLCAQYNIHPLVVEDVLSVGQRAKMDEIGDIVFCLLPMLYFNAEAGAVETEQVSIVVGDHFLISFQEDALRDVFDPVRERLRNGNVRLRSSGTDYLAYSLLDVIVDSYFSVIEALAGCIEDLEDELILGRDREILPRIAFLRREITSLHRAIQPVRELVNGFLRSEHPLIEDRSDKYFKDVLDHIIQANEYTETQRERLLSLQELYMSQINLRMNQVMKIFTMVTVLLAPATVIGGIFGMNFDVIPLTHQQRGFYIMVGLMLVIPVFMLLYFKRKKWF